MTETSTRKRRHLRAVRKPAEVADSPVTISYDRFCELLAVELLAAQAVAKTWQHRRRGWEKAAVGLTDPLAEIVDVELVDACLDEDERMARLVERTVKLEN